MPAQRTTSSIATGPWRLRRLCREQGQRMRTQRIDDFWRAGVDDVTPELARLFVEVARPFRRVVICVEEHYREAHAICRACGDRILRIERALEHDQRMRSEYVLRSLDPVPGHRLLPAAARFPACDHLLGGWDAKAIERERRKMLVCDSRA